MSLNRDVIAIDTERLGTVFVPILSRIAIAAIMRRADELYPLPNAKEYEQPLPDAVIEGDVLPAKDNPQYVTDVTRVMLKRNRHLQDAILAMLRLDGITRDEVIEVFKPELDVLRKSASIEQEDDFVAILRNCVLSVDEYRAITEAASKAQPLTQEEIRAGMRIFRRDLQRSSTDGHAGDAESRRVQQEESIPAQHAAG